MRKGRRKTFSTPPHDTCASVDQLRLELESIFGIWPSFLKLSQDDPLTAQQLFRITKLAYVDSRMPLLLKDKLFTWLSRFCDVRYCVTRNCAFLLRQGVT